MARKPDHPCVHPGCPNLVPAGQKYCEEHKSLHPEEVRSAASRGYNSRWRRESKKFLELHPLCQECLKKGIATPATVVDHIVPHRGDVKLFWDRSNWQALCESCHDKKPDGKIPIRFTATEVSHEAACPDLVWNTEHVVLPWCRRGQHKKRRSFSR